MLETPHTLLTHEPASVKAAQRVKRPAPYGCNMHGVAHQGHLCCAAEAGSEVYQAWQTREEASEICDLRDLRVSESLNQPMGRWPQSPVANEVPKPCPRQEARRGICKDSVLIFRPLADLCQGHWSLDHTVDAQAAACRQHAVAIQPIKGRTRQCLLWEACWRIAQFRNDWTGSNHRSMHERRRE
jgi:hypothetical protein